MCGIAGFFTTHFPAGQDMAQVARDMAAQLNHRGPNDEGVWVDQAAGIVLAHRRLSILDLSAAGHQPMLSRCGRYVLVFNGEIYNHLEIRQELDDRETGNGWRGHSDTETLLSAIACWGLERTLQKSVGMFAIALWDRKERALFLTRDRMGEKPLYYGLHGDTLLFASELKALRAYPGFKAEVDRQALTLLLRHSAIPTPYSIYQGIFKLLPGTVLKLSQADVAKRALPSPMSYWSLRKLAEEGQQNQFTYSDTEAIAELEHLLRQSIAGQMVADVPLGAFLSGGIDSSTVVALMQTLSDRPVKTFTIGFDDAGYNEAKHAKAVASHLGTEHTELYVSPEDAMEVIPRLPTLYDEPFSDYSQIPTFLVSQITKQHVTVSLSGDAGDELFGGYNRYFWVNRILRRIERIPTPLRGVAAKGISAVSPEKWDNLLGGISRTLPIKWRMRHPGDKAHKLAEILTANTPEEIYQRLLSNWTNPSDVVIGATEPLTVLTDRTAWPNLPDFEHHMMYMDAISYLPDDILVKVDRAAMGISLETRVPFLDHRLIEFAWQLPLSMKIRDRQGKWVLRQVLYKYVPRKLIERPKMGFAVPIDHWLRGPLREWAEALLGDDRLRREGFFNPAPIRKKWQEHLSGKLNWQYHLWDVLMFQAWLEAQSK